MTPRDITDRAPRERRLVLPERRCNGAGARMTPETRHPPSELNKRSNASTEQGSDDPESYGSQPVARRKV